MCAAKRNALLPSNARCCSGVRFRFWAISYNSTTLKLAFIAAASPSLCLEPIVSLLKEPFVGRLHDDVLGTSFGMASRVRVNKRRVALGCVFATSLSARNSRPATSGMPKPAQTWINSSSKGEKST